MSDKSTQNLELKKCEGNKFFDILENCVEFKIPTQLKMILNLNLLNNATSLSRGILISINEIEEFMKQKFNKKMLKSNESMAEYLGCWKQNQQKFQLMSGHKRMLTVISEYCRKLYEHDDESATPAQCVPSE